MTLSEKEVFFQRLYTRTKSLCLLEKECNIYRLKSNVKTLEHLYIFLQDDKNLSEEMLLSYGNWLYELKVILEALLQKSTEDKIKVLDKLPRTYPNISYDSSNDTKHNDNLSTNAVNATLRNRYYKDCRDDLLHNKKKNSDEANLSVYQTVYYADLRNELFGDETVLGNGNTELSSDEYMLQQSEKQEKLANELLNLTKAMKSNFQATGKVLKDDNALLHTMSQKFDKSKDKLSIESKNLSLHARGSLCDCLTFLMIFVVIWSFIGMAMMMRFFPKNVI
ncbi:Vesicle transport protein USE1 [Strongyloides ratti]|uniref:Vesicle transport protein USE1 n=1 Tax=Strongyloides ratti TaxID=34506 RepID=A0A090L673_STRRB|nr:Vesicle transport protein USE1 [Strongyloides ratti]CEF63623.1 Vesicle transport protein USE1 [Strongyloides ratti]